MNVVDEVMASGDFDVSNLARELWLRNYDHSLGAESQYDRVHRAFADAEMFFRYADKRAAEVQTNG